jgi:murein DD-endopeptidase MepM/ murein hydrolase activator NlpD
MHLTQDGALVSMGESVMRGDTLGLSGATGLAGYPHLHFVVTESDWAWPYASTPVTFSNTDANPRGLQAGGTYTALPY